MFALKIIMLFIISFAQGQSVLKCGSTSSSKVISLVSPPKPESCVYNVKPTNSRICQIRVDFETFTLAQPSIDSYIQCKNDQFTAGNLGISLCGDNKGQHIYVPVPSGVKTLPIAFTLINRTITDDLPTPSWNLKVTQLECAPEMSSRSSRTYSLTADAKSVAPFGCLQYHTNKSGIIETFNMGFGPYIGGMNYAICFKRTPLDTKIHFIPTIFSLGYGQIDEQNNGYDDACYPNIETVGFSEDNLFIPYAYVDTFPILRATRFCGNSILSHNIVSSAPGPFVINFNSDKVFEGDQKPEIGFRIRYEII